MAHMNEGDTRACPACAEPILQAANKCKHCGEWLAEVAPAPHEVSPPSAAALYKQAHDAHHKAKDVDAAESLYLRVLSDFPGSPEASYAQTQLGRLEADRTAIQARALRREGMYEADRQKEKAEKKDELLKSTYKQALDAHYKTKNIDEAALLYRQIIEGSPGSEEAGYARSQLANIEKSVVAGIKQESDKPVAPGFEGGDASSTRARVETVQPERRLKDPRLLVLGALVAVGLGVWAISAFGPSSNQPSKEIPSPGLAIDDEGDNGVSADRELVAQLRGSTIPELDCDMALKVRIASEPAESYQGEFCPKLEELLAMTVGDEFEGRDLDEAKATTRAACFEAIKRESAALPAVILARSPLKRSEYDFESKAFILSSSEVELIDGLLVLNSCANPVLTEGAKKGLSGRFETQSIPQVGGVTLNETRRFIDIALSMTETAAREFKSSEEGPFVLEILFRTGTSGDTPLVSSLGGMMESKVKGLNGHAIAYRVVGSKEIIPWTFEE